MKGLFANKEQTNPPHSTGQTQPALRNPRPRPLLVWSLCPGRRPSFPELPQEDNSQWVYSFISGNGAQTCPHTGAGRAGRAGHGHKNQKMWHQPGGHGHSRVQAPCAPMRVGAHTRAHMALGTEQRADAARCPLPTYGIAEAFIQQGWGEERRPHWAQGSCVPPLLVLQDSQAPTQLQSQVPAPPPRAGLWGPGRFLTSK